MGSQKIAAHRFVLAERCVYFQTAFAESSTFVDDIPILSFDFNTVELMTSFHHLLTFLYTDMCSLLTAGSRTVHTDTVDSSRKDGTNRSKRTVSAKDTAGTCVNAAVIIDDPVTSLKTMARHFGVASLVRRYTILTWFRCSKYCIAYFTNKF